MGIIITAIIALALYRIEMKVNIRAKYQSFSQKFAGYYIDFISFIVALGTIFGLMYLVWDIVPRNVSDILFAVMFICSIYIIIPINDNMQR